MSEEQDALMHLGELTMLNRFLSEFIGRAPISEQALITWSEREIKRLEEALTYEREPDEAQR